MRAATIDLRESGRGRIMRWIIPLPLFIVGGIFVLQTPLQAQTDDAHLPVSMERIRAALKQPPPILRGPAPAGSMPTFHVEVRGRLPVLLPLDEQPFDPTYGLPSVGDLMMDGIDKIRNAVVNYRRGRAERRARKEVDDALAAYCAAGGCPPSTTRK
jgi:hypothetical protein